MQYLLCSLFIMHAKCYTELAYVELLSSSRDMLNLKSNIGMIYATVRYGYANNKPDMQDKVSCTPPLKTNLIPIRLK